ncbi:MAG TPA: hypothetical protein VFK10_15920, partial [Burkholderiaceae bacterium]|nr:hypothetical protein [Burkholderiaceae bacterium]
MDRAAFPVESMDALELRVLQGPQSGARAPLTAGVPSVLAAGPDSGDGADIVLRDPSLAPTRLRVSADAPHAILEVLQGDVQLGDETLSAGAQTLWPMNAPLRVGSLVVAFGRACVDDWPAATERSAAASGADSASPSTKVPLRRRVEVWLAAMGAGVLVVCAAALWMAHAAAAPVVAASPDAAALSAALRGGEFAALQVVRGADGQMTLRGRLATEAAREKLDAWLLGLGVQPRVDVAVDESMAREVSEVFRVNGVAV